ncbi:hypothetical protein [Bradyrhizobium commune]|uniref:Uncharacterized protein n=1 Tax=Bradyrhizobium commune TaxID=83627 RepID=A0A7S9D4G2_9BRAD|nr:hypothetical protein [Bradyrhizobium commune]QPF90244.1 hypothetical protein IC761_27635 [Bradyrhizobium commune]
MEVAVAAIAAVCYRYGYYHLAFWLIAVAIFYALLVLAKSMASRSWYSSQRAKAGLKEGKGFGILIVTKLVILIALSFGAMRLAELTDYGGIGTQLSTLCSSGTQGLRKRCADWIGTQQKRP